MAYQPSVQLYSLRDAVGADLDAALARVAEIGYSIVEPYAFAERAEDYRRAFAAHGLSAPSGHNGVIDSETPEKVFAAAAGLGIGTVIDPFIPTDRWQNADDARRLADRMNELAPLAAKEGVAFGYHNHNWELATRDQGRHVFEYFTEALDPEVVLEVDTFWATVGGADTPALLRSLGDRVKFLHIKDGTVSGDIASELPSSEDAMKVSDRLEKAMNEQVPAGQGDVDIPAILNAAPQATRVVEFDGYSGDIFEGIAASLAWLQKNDAQATGGAA